MSGSSAFNSGGSPQVSRTLPGEAAAPPPAPETAELLENVLRATLAVCASDEPLDRAQMERFLEVTKRHRGQPVTAEPVGRELVFAALEGQFPSPHGEGFWQAMASQIARTLFEDPLARQRLERLWASLCEEAG